jgi:hypothetical protein
MRLFQPNHIKYGIAMLAVTALCLLLMEVSGNNKTFQNNSPYTLFYTFIAPFVIWFLGIRERKIAQKGKLTLKDGIKESVGIAVVYAVASPFLFLFYYLAINPGILSYVKKAYGLTNSPNEVVIFVDMLVQFIAAIIGGTLYGAILTFFLKSKEK